MKKWFTLYIIFSLVSLVYACSVNERNDSYFQQAQPLPLIDSLGNTIQERFNPPFGYERKMIDSASFGYFLRNFRLKKDQSPVMLFNGNLKANQQIHAAVLAVSVGKKDLQQCADAVMRLRAEYLFAQKRFTEIHFQFVSGFTCAYSKWREGNRVSVDGNKVNWVKSSARDTSYNSFLKYLETVFSFAGTLSLDRELKPVPLNEVQIGDVFIRGGSPGHAVIVVDLIENQAGKKMVLLAQSYMPAQDIHILKNPMNNSISPWYDLEQLDKIYTPEWTFEANQLKRF